MGARSTARVWKMSLCGLYGDGLRKQKGRTPEGQGEGLDLSARVGPPRASEASSRSTSASTVQQGRGQRRAKASAQQVQVTTRLMWDRSERDISM